MPVQCQQCENPPCVKVCPVHATWKEPDGLVVVDYNWCIGCRYCIAACPYRGRTFNWSEPKLAKEEWNTDGPLPGQPAAIEECRGQMYLLHSAREKRQIPGLRRGVSDRDEKVRKPARSRQRDPLPDRPQEGLPAQGRPEHGAQVLLLLCGSRHAIFRGEVGDVEAWRFYKKTLRLVVIRGTPLLRLVPLPDLYHSRRVSDTICNSSTRV